MAEPTSPDPVGSEKRRAWLATKLYRASGRLYGLASKVEGPQPACPECGFDLSGDECPACIDRDERDKMLGEAYDDGQHDAWRDAESEGLLEVPRE